MKHVSSGDKKLPWSAPGYVHVGVSRGGLLDLYSKRTLHCFPGLIANFLWRALSPGAGNSGMSPRRREQVYPDVTSPADWLTARLTVELTSEKRAGACELPSGVQAHRLPASPGNIPSVPREHVATGGSHARRLWSDVYPRN